MLPIPREPQAQAANPLSPGVKQQLGAQQTSGV